MSVSKKFTFQEFFAGGGMVRQGLGEKWSCVFANDFDGKKAMIYQQNWGLNGELFVGNIKEVDENHLNTASDLAWASFPCQDLSLAGKGNGLNAERSGMFHVFWERLNLAAKNIGMPKIVAIENVCGMLTSNRGMDFQAVVQKFSDNGYFVGALILDAKDFLPQSRKRVFIIGIRKDLSIDPALVSTTPLKYCHPKQLIRAYDELPFNLRNSWIWFNIHKPVSRDSDLIDVLEPPNKMKWNSQEKTQSILDKMSTINIKKVEAAQNTGSPNVGALFLRTRRVGKAKQVFAEVRFDGISGCLRTPNGGSSRQSILYIEGQTIRSRLLTGRETARLMGLPETFKLPENQNAALHLTGDGVAVPVVEHLKNCLFEHILLGQTVSKDKINNLFKVA